MYVAYVFAVLTGFVFAGFVYSLFVVITGREPSEDMILFPTGHFLLEVPIVILSAPYILGKSGIYRIWERGHVKLGTAAIIGAAGWSFMQGVLVLTAIYKL